MPEEFIQFLKNLTPEKWEVKVDSNWTVKDVVAHLVGWEEECVNQLSVIWKTKQPPWFMDETLDDDFNKKSVEKYGSLTPLELINEWEKWLLKGKGEVLKIGEEKMKENPDLFGFWFDLSHYQAHYKQLKDLVSSKE